MYYFITNHNQAEAMLSDCFNTSHHFFKNILEMLFT